MKNAYAIFICWQTWIRKMLHLYLITNPMGSRIPNNNFWYWSWKFCFYFMCPLIRICMLNSDWNEHFFWFNLFKSEPQYHNPGGLVDVQLYIFDDNKRFLGRTKNGIWEGELLPGRYTLVPHTTGARLKHRYYSMIQYRSPKPQKLDQYQLKTTSIIKYQFALYTLGWFVIND